MVLYYFHQENFPPPSSSTALMSHLTDKIKSARIMYHYYSFFFFKFMPLSHRSEDHVHLRPLTFTLRQKLIWISILSSDLLENQEVLKSIFSPFPRDSFKRGVSRHAKRIASCFSCSYIFHLLFSLESWWMIYFRVYLKK